MHFESNVAKPIWHNVVDMGKWTKQYQKKSICCRSLWNYLLFDAYNQICMSCNMIDKFLCFCSQSSVGMVVADVPVPIGSRTSATIMTMQTRWHISGRIHCNGCVCETTLAHQLLPMLVTQWPMLRQNFLHKNTLNISQNAVIGQRWWILFRKCCNGLSFHLEWNRIHHWYQAYNRQTHGLVQY